MARTAAADDKIEFTLPTSATRITKEALPPDLANASTVELGRRHLAGNGIAAHRARKNGKAAKWASGRAGDGTPTWVCPKCGLTHGQSTCPALCTGCGEHGDPKQALGDDLPAHAAAACEPGKLVGTVPGSGAPEEAIAWLWVKDIAPHPENPRKHFDREKLEELAASFKKVGVINPLTVRAMGHDFYQLVAGERRWRAAVIAKLATVPCRIVDITDEEAYEVMIRENLDREDLDEIEKARSYQLGLEKCGLTQEAFAKRFQKSQEHVSNTIRLLQLPEAWQSRLIQRQITATHARELLAWLDLPKVLEKVEKRFDAKNVPSAVEFRRLLIEAAHESSRSMVYSKYCYGNSFCFFKPTPTQKKQLDIREVPRSYGGKERRAFNTRLWAELQIAAKNRKKAKESQDVAKRNDAGDSGKDGGKAAARQAAQRKREDFLQRLWLYKRNWIAAQIGERLDPDQTTLIHKTALVMLMSSEDGPFQDDRTWKSIDLKYDRWDGDGNAAQVAPMTPQAADAALYRVVRTYLSQQQEESHDDPVPAAFLGSVAKTLHIDLSRAWQPDVSFLSLLDEEQLSELVEQWPDAPASPVGVPDEILAAWPKGFVPDDLLWVDERGQIKRPKGAAKPRKKAKARA